MNDPRAVRSTVLGRKGKRIPGCLKFWLQCGGSLGIAENICGMGSV